MSLKCPNSDNNNICFILITLWFVFQLAAHRLCKCERRNHTLMRIKKTRSFGGRDLWFQINSRVVWLAREHDSTQLLGVHCMFQLNAFHIANKKTECCFVMTYLSFLCVKIKSYRFTDSTNSDQKKKAKKRNTKYL